VHFHRVQVSRAKVARRFLRSVLAAAGSLRQLLAALLLLSQCGCQTGTAARAGKRRCRAGSLDERKVRLNEARVSPGYTSNDLLFSLNGDNAGRSLNYQTIAQSAEEVGEVRNAPALTMGPYLFGSGQTNLLNAISIYSQRGRQYDQLRLLFMNSTALRIWREMGQRPWVIGAQHRPPSTALLTFGVPFSE
jgi:hypothetical protein